jgi:AraC-like DNA-binding protein
VEHDRIHARDGALVTSAGVTAGIDLALALVSEDHGEALACAKRLVVVAQRQGGQSQFSPLLVAQRDPDSPIGKVQTYVVNHLAEPLSVKRLAEIAGASERSVARLFVKELGQTPHDFVEGVRIDQARNMLEATERSIKAIAFDCGFASPQQMRAAFQRRLGLSPLRYRESFRSSRSVDGTATSASKHRYEINMLIGSLQGARLIAKMTEKRSVAARQFWDVRLLTLNGKVGVECGRSAILRKRSEADAQLRAEAPSIVRRRKADDFLEDLSESTRIGVAHAPGDRLGRV